MFESKPAAAAPSRPACDGARRNHSHQRPRGRHRRRRMGNQARRGDDRESLQMTPKTRQASAAVSIKQSRKSPCLKRAISAYGLGRSGEWPQAGGGGSQASLPSLPPMPANLTRIAAWQPALFRLSAALLTAAGPRAEALAGNESWRPEQWCRGDLVW